MTSQPDSLLRFRKLFVLNDHALNDFELVMSQLDAKEIKNNHTKSTTYLQDHQLELKIQWFETNDEAIHNKFLKDVEMPES